MVDWFNSSFQTFVPPWKWNGWANNFVEFRRDGPKKGPTSTRSRDVILQNAQKCKFSETYAHQILIPLVRSTQEYYWAEWEKRTEVFIWIAAMNLTCVADDSFNNRHPTITIKNISYHRTNVVGWGMAVGVGRRTKGWLFSRSNSVTLKVLKEELHDWFSPDKYRFYIACCERGDDPALQMPLDENYRRKPRQEEKRNYMSWSSGHILLSECLAMKGT